MMMIICAILIAVGIIATVVAAVKIDLSHEPTPPMILFFFLSAIVALSAVVSFVVGHFVGV